MSSKKREDVSKELYETYYTKKDIGLENRYFYSFNVGTKGSYLKGKIYTFDYFYTNGSEERKYIDVRPMVFVVSEYFDKKNRKYKFKGINFNYVPEVGVMYIMEKYFDIYRLYIERDLNLIKQNILPSYFERKGVDKIFSDLKKETNISYAVRTYHKDRVIPMTTTVVKTEDYNKIYMYKGYEKSLKGLSYKEIQSNWYKTL